MGKIHLFKAIGCFLLAALPALLSAQGSQSQGIQFNIKSPGVTTTYEENNCSFLGAPDLSTPGRPNRKRQRL